MSSLNLNVAAQVALRTVRVSQSDMVRGEQRVATGLRIQDPEDGAAYWSIATTMRSDMNAMTAVKDALALGFATVSVAYSAINNVMKLVDQMKERLVAAREPGADVSKIQANIEALQAQMLSTAESATFSGQNWLSIDSSAGTDISKTIVASFSRSSSTDVAVGTIGLQLYDAASGETLALVDRNANASARMGFLDRSLTDSTGAQYQISTVSIAGIDRSAAGDAKLDSLIQGVDDTLVRMTAAATRLGSTMGRIELQRNLTDDLISALENGIGRLIDANMDEESTRLQALQTKQSLGIQSLSIANQGGKSFLQLLQ